MATINNLLTSDEIERIHVISSVVEEKNRLDRSRMFMVELPKDIHEKLCRILGIELERRVPFRWISGDTPMHVDRAWDHKTFEHTYLIYLSDSHGGFRIRDEIFPIRAGDGFCFDANVPHATVGTSSDRLLMGPFNEYSVPVGYSGVYYIDSEGAYFNQDDYSGVLLSINQINTIGGGGTPFLIPPGKTFAGWAYYPEYSYGTTTIDGRTPTDGEVFQVGDSYSTSGGLSLISVFNDGLNVFCNNLYIQLTNTGKVIFAGDITLCELTEKIGVKKTYVATNEFFYQRSRANNTIPSRNGFATR